LRNLPLFLLFLWEENKSSDCPNPEQESEKGPQVFGIAIVPCEQATHNPIEQVNNQRGYNEGLVREAPPKQS
jgi:hypothetical protein